MPPACAWHAGENRREGANGRRKREGENYMSVRGTRRRPLRGLSTSSAGGGGEPSLALRVASPNGILDRD